MNFKVGDKVQVVKKIDETIVGWNESMTRAIGKKGIIKKAFIMFDEQYVNINFIDEVGLSAWTYPSSSLKYSKKRIG